MNIVTKDLAVVDVGLSRMLNTDQSKKQSLSLAVLRIQIKDV